MLIDEILHHEAEMIAIRQDFHAHPELGFEEHRTSSKIVQLLQGWGYNVHRGLGVTGVVGSLKVGNSPRHLGLRADMDALPMQEYSGVPFSSQQPGRMHACGHDGHSAILLSAARYLAENRQFDGTLHVIFQPAEEGLGGASRMIEEGLFTRFPCDAIFALHNAPQLPLGMFMALPGPMLASSDSATIRIYGKGGHGSTPENCIDPVVVGSAIVMALQTIVARNINPQDAAVITVGSLIGGSTYNVIPDSAELKLTIRALTPAAREQLKQRIIVLVTAQAASFGARAEIEYQFLHPVLVNHQKETRFALEVAAETFGSEQVISPERGQRAMGSEDFAFMLEQRPGCFLAMGTGTGGEDPGLHHPGYRFNDRAIAIGATFWARLAQRFLAQ